MLSDELSREPLMAEYRVEVQALDSGRPRMMNSTTISITVPHNTAPELIGPEEFYVAENQKPGAFVGEISARVLGELRDPWETVLRDPSRWPVLTLSRPPRSSANRRGAGARRRTLLRAALLIDPREKPLPRLQRGHLIGHSVRSSRHIV